MAIDVRAALDRHLSSYVERSVDVRSLGSDASLREDLGLSSLEAVGLLSAIEAEFDVEISDDEVTGLRVLGDVIRLVEAKLAAN
jgi:acyl carrier protein